ncbi:DUF1761 domain-containing protein [Agromyces sp. SYSU K20354]|uniref:DUF1761 domain-containing protein n=1 Tax=Agromyces cavernae TaxID=2898659 RepID=UPI001E357CE2|nr:DUF1761 domain-containing protein [Agromyces cavernae]MCD2443518.1 DUF1761 domain-containing protein [Agromyces cavernae]
MIEALTRLDWIAIGLATLASYVLGALWFTPLFGRAWDRSLGISRERGTRYPPIYYLMPFVSSVLVSVATAILVTAIGAEGWGESAVLGLVVGIGYSAAVTFTNAVNPVTPHPLAFAAITGSYHVVSAVAAAVIIGAF